MTTLTMIVLATLLGGLLSMVAAAGLVFRLSRQATATLVAFAAGGMLSSALLDILPDAFAGFEAGAGQSLYATLLAGLLGFFTLERLALWRHAHADCEEDEGEQQAEVAAHEVPQELGDFVLLLNAGWSRRKAFLANAAFSLTSVLGGLLGYFAGMAPSSSCHMS